MRRCLRAPRLSSWSCDTKRSSRVLFLGVPASEETTPANSSGFPRDLSQAVGTHNRAGRVAHRRPFAFHSRRTLAFRHGRVWRLCAAPFGAKGRFFSCGALSAALNPWRLASRGKIEVTLAEHRAPSASLVALGAASFAGRKDFPRSCCRCRACASNCVFPRERLELLQRLMGSSKK